MWNDKESFISWLYEEKEKSYQILVKELKKLNYENIEREYISNNLNKIYSLKQSKKWINLCYNQLYKVDDYKNIISDKIVNYLDSIYSLEPLFYKNPELWEYEEFIFCAYFIKRFEKTKLSKIKKEYNREVKQLQKRADEVAKYSFEPITIIIPRRTQEILSYLKFKLMFSDNIKDFLYFFNYSTKNITVRSYLEFSKQNIKAIELIRKSLGIEQSTAITYLAKELNHSKLIDTIKISKEFNNETNPFITIYKINNTEF